MPIRRRKNIFCLNCNHPLEEENNFCPNCGQENNDRNVAFSEFVHDVFSNFFAYDSQFFRSVIPFLFKPGYLTNQFLNGKRRKYINPLRMYFATSFIFFLLLASLPEYEKKPLINLGKLTPKSDSLSQNEEEDSEEIDEDSIAKAEIKNNIKKTLKSNGITYSSSMDSVIAKKKNKYSSKTLREKAKKEILNLQKDSIKRNTLEGVYDLITNDSIRNMIQKKKLSPEEVMLSLKINPTFINRIVVKQAVKLASDGGGESLQSYIWSKIPMMMFILMPIVALILKVLYIGFSRPLILLTDYSKSAVRLASNSVKAILKPRSGSLNEMDPKVLQKSPFRPGNRYYIEHLIFTLNIHSFAFFMFSLLMLSKAANLPGFMRVVMGFWIGIYLWLSFKYVYKQGWFKTTVKIWLLSMMYIFCLAICLVFLVGLSVILF